MESKKDEHDSNSDKSSRSKISKQKACWDETQHSAPRSPGPRVPSAQPRTCWERGSPGHGSSRRGNSQVSGLASARQPGISRRAGAHWTAGAVRKQRRRSPGAPLSPLPPSGHPAAGSPGAPTLPGPELAFWGASVRQPGGRGSEQCTGKYASDASLLSNV